MIYILNFLYLKISQYIEYKSHKGSYIRFCTIFLSTAFLLLTPILNKICCYFIRYLLLGFGNTIHVLSKYQVNLIFVLIKILETKYRKWQQMAFFSFQYNKICIKEMNRSFCLEIIFVAKFAFFQKCCNFYKLYSICVLKL